MVDYKIGKLIFLGAIFAVGAAKDEKILVRLPRQSHGKNGPSDQSSAETGFLGGGGVENSKYFHYQHLPEHDKYEFGHRRGNDHHVVERYEKAVPHEGQFKTKVRWADKKGGHGEHYWDYNHAGHGGNNQNDGDGGYSDPVPVYSGHQKSLKQLQKRQLDSDRKITLEDLEGTQQPQASTNYESHATQDGQLKSIEKEIQGVQGHDIQKEIVKEKRATEAKPKAGSQPTGSSQWINIKNSGLFLDLNSGKVVDEITGKKYVLQPSN